MKSANVLCHPRALRALVLAGIALCVIPARAGLFDDEEARRAILDLRQRIENSSQALEQKIAIESKRSSDENEQSRRSLIELQNQLEATRSDLAKLRGQNEQIARDVAEMQRKQKDDAQLLNERLRKLEPQRVTVDGRDFLADNAEKRDFEAALVIFRKGEFANAEVVFVDFINRYPQSGYRPSALFWLGNAQYATKDYKDALVNFRNLVTQTPDHLRTPEALLAIANCQLEIKDTKGARKTLEELIASHPSTEAAAAAKERLARLK
jgi:tol-pal system protein YbgF